jgi:putative FmdB family regulatory protein
MPLYEYLCSACGHQFERIVKFSDAPLTTCPKCGKETIEQMISAPAVQFKGSGWYVTDYASKGNKAAYAASAKSDNAPASTESSSSASEASAPSASSGEKSSSSGEAGSSASGGSTSDSGSSASSSSASSSSAKSGGESQ